MTTTDEPMITNGLPAITETFARPRGRGVPEYPTYTFKGSGETCRVRRLSPITMQRLQQAIIAEARAYPPDHEHAYPQPPAERIAVGGGPERDEPNPNDPAYKDRLAKWETWAQTEIMERFLRIAAVDACIFDPGQIDADHIDRLRRRMASEGAPLPFLPAYTPEENDQILWVQHVCIATNEDLADFVSFLLTRTEVKEPEVAAHIATFPAA